MDPVLIGLLGILAILTLWFACVLLRDVVAHKNEPSDKPIWISAVIGLVTNFFDTLGIGSFAPTTAAFKATKAVDDGIIPGTLNTAHAIPVALMAFIFITAVEVELVTLISLLAASTLGSWFGADIVSKLDRSKIQLVLGVGLLLIAFLFIAGLLDWIDALGTGEAVGLAPDMLIIGIVAHLILGALMSAGVGLYAPSMAVVYMLGLSPAVAFPIMMGSCAFLMQPAGVKFVREGKYARKPALAINIFGCIGVIIAVSIVTNLPMDALRILVVVVITYTSITMLNSWRKTRQAATTT